MSAKSGAEVVKSECVLGKQDNISMVYKRSFAFKCAMQFHFIVGIFPMPVSICVQCVCQCLHACTLARYQRIHSLLFAQCDAFLFVEISTKYVRLCLCSRFHIHFFRTPFANVISIMYVMVFQVSAAR